MVIPTTDEMDHTTAEERPKLIGMCDTCFEWTPFNDLTDERVCKNKDGKLLQSTVRSQRSFDAEWGKKESAKVKRKAKK